MKEEDRKEMQSKNRDQVDFRFPACGIFICTGFSTR